ncbi:MAG: rhodanese-like domain-containing protein [Herbaspirillum sp.]
MQHISVEQLDSWLVDSARPAPLLLDVREAWEFNLCHLDDARSMPMNSVPQHLAELQAASATTEIVCICHHGMRSLQVAEFLEQQGCSGMANLNGGIDAWAQQIDPEMARY